MGEAKRRAMHASKQIFRCYPVPDPEEEGQRWNVNNEFIADSAIAAEIESWLGLFEQPVGCG